MPRHHSLRCPKTIPAATTPSIPAGVLSKPESACGWPMRRRGTYLRLGALEEKVAIVSARSLASDAYLFQLLHASHHNYAGQERMLLQDIHAQNQNQGSQSVHMQAPCDGGTSVQQNFIAQDGLEPPVHFTHHLPARYKRKGIVETGEEASPQLDMVNPYSPKTDGGLFMDRSSFPCIFHDVYELSSWAQVDATTQFCGLFKSIDGDQCPSKVPMLERVDITTMGAGSGCVMTLMQVLTQSYPPMCLQSLPPRELQGPEELVIDEHLLRQTLPPSYPKPTVAMSLTLADCKLAAYIFGESENVGIGREMLFKESTFCIPEESSSPSAQELNPTVI
ncbi:hypothetical protein PIB30_032216 [Stylosanthes scabra]|uniref:Uncharacterized protein n=1 Tax=Stylosanthes scabra TaxID=79078 RepID=A0ABU6TE83_9FABA|nr:hypothetical protein [Stylosanthes scabra]